MNFSKIIANLLCACPVHAFYINGRNLSAFVEALRPIADVSVQPFVDRIHKEFLQNHEANMRQGVNDPDSTVLYASNTGQMTKLVPWAKRIEQVVPTDQFHLAVQQVENAERQRFIKTGDIGNFGIKPLPANADTVQFDRQLSLDTGIKGHLDLAELSDLVKALPDECQQINVDFLKNVIASLKRLKLYSGKVEEYLFWSSLGRKAPLANLDSILYFIERDDFCGRRVSRDHFVAGLISHVPADKLPAFFKYLNWCILHNYPATWRAISDRSISLASNAMPPVLMNWVGGLKRSNSWIMLAVAAGADQVVSAMLPALQKEHLLHHRDGFGRNALMYTIGSSMLKRGTDGPGVSLQFLDDKFNFTTEDLLLVDDTGNTVVGLLMKEVLAKIKKPKMNETALPNAIASSLEFVLSRTTKSDVVNVMSSIDLFQSIPADYNQMSINQLLRSEKNKVWLLFDTLERLHLAFQMYPEVGLPIITQLLAKNDKFTHLIERGASQKDGYRYVEFLSFWQAGRYHFLTNLMKREFRAVANVLGARKTRAIPACDASRHVRDHLLPFFSEIKRNRQNLQLITVADSPTASRDQNRKKNKIQESTRAFFTQFNDVMTKIGNARYKALD